MTILQISWQILMIFMFCAVVYSGILFVKALDKYLQSLESKKKKKIVKQSLGELLKSIVIGVR